MVSAIANPNVAAPSAESAPPSASSSFLNSAASPNNLPTFADAIHTALNKPNSVANPSPTNDSQTIQQDLAQPVSSSPISPPAPSALGATLTKRISKPQETPTIPLQQNSAILPNQIPYAPLFAAATTLLAAATTPEIGAPNGGTSTAPPDVPEGLDATSPNNTQSALPSADSQNDSLASTHLPPEGVMVLAALETAATEDNSADFGKTVADLNCAALDSAANTPEHLSPQLTSSLNPALNTSLSSTPASAPDASAPSQSTAPTVRMVVPSPVVTPNHSQALSPVLQQIHDLLASDLSGRLPAAGIIEIARANAPSQAGTMDHSALFSATEHPSSLAIAVGNTSKDFQNTRPEPRVGPPAASAAVSALTSGNPRSAAQNSSADSNRQDSSGSADSSNSPDSSSPDALLGKPLATNLSDLLAANATPHVEAAQPVAAPAPAPTQILVPPPPGSANHPEPTETLPSAPAQAAQPTLPQLHAPDTTVGRFVNDAELSNAASQSEMRIAIQTDKLGAIELRAHVTGDELGAAIIVEKRDAHAALAVELPALQQTLSEKQLRVEQVILAQGSLHSTAGDAGANAQQGQRGGSQAFRQSSAYSNETVGLQQAAWFVPEAVGVFDSQGRLSVQA